MLIYDLNFVMTRLLQVKNGRIAGGKYVIRVDPRGRTRVKRENLGKGVGSYFPCDSLMVAEE